ncbi:hypothetical protein [Adlercreutzia sp. ZJ138]|uniref:hypothetical protein n=1 Tax=Adlercreutzia sp. ZJ138 TaxID=2709405 RepID=UPI00351AF1CC
MTNHNSGSDRRPFAVIPPCVYEQAARRMPADDVTERALGDVREKRVDDMRDAFDDATFDEQLAYVQRILLQERAARPFPRRAQERSPFYGVLQDFVDSLFEGDCDAVLRRLDVVVAAESAELPADLLEVVELLPPGSYTRQRLCGQLNSAIGAHAWSRTYGTVS